MPRNHEQQPDSPDPRQPQREMKRASDYGGGDPTLIPASKIREIMDRDLILGNFKKGTGQYGEYYRLNLTDPATGEEIVAYSQHTFVVEFLDKLDPVQVCPMLVTFYYFDVKPGRRSICIR